MQCSPLQFTIKAADEQPCEEVKRARSTDEQPGEEVKRERSGRSIGASVPVELGSLTLPAGGGVFPLFKGHTSYWIRAHL